jgi:hypothetical protein
LVNLFEEALGSPGDESPLKRLYLARSNINRQRAMPIRDWTTAQTHLTFLLEVRPLPPDSSVILILTEPQIVVDGAGHATRINE